MTDDVRAYNIVRFYKDHLQGIVRRVVRTRVTLEEAQEHCGDPETSSSTCRQPENVRRTERVGPWFDGYESR